ncbi:MAG: D-amino acid aminotransferase [Armatimonadota bacterium]|nr:D-amino acid aminotransferase [Armatimonadota bacterium]
MQEIACLNGRFMPVCDAAVPVDDRGFLFGDSVYEVVRTYEGRIWALDRHLARLSRSLRAIYIENVDLAALRTNLLEAHRRSGIPNALIYVQVTRGVAPRSHVPEQTLEPTVLITVRPFHAPAPSFSAERGVRAILLPELRWARRDIKSTNLLPNILAKREARARGAFEAIFVTHEGAITEGSSSNVFVVRGGVMRTPPNGPDLLPGITRDLALELARREGIPAEESPLTRDELLAGDEVFLTGTGSEIAGVIAVDDQAIGGGEVGPITRRLLHAYHAAIASPPEWV